MTSKQQDEMREALRKWFYHNDREFPRNDMTARVAYQAYEFALQSLPRVTEEEMAKCIAGACYSGNADYSQRFADENWRYYIRHAKVVLAKLPKEIL